MRKTILRTMAVGLVAAGALAGTGVTHVHAAAGVSFTDAVGDVLDPILSQNRLVAVPSTAPRPYADLTGVTATPNGSSDVSFAVSTAGALPTFPVTNGDAGIEFNACFDIPGNEAIANGPVQVGTGHHGAPVYDGPYNSNYGWKACAWFSAQAGGLANITDYGVATFDPVGQYTFFDQAQLGGNILAPSVSGTTVTFHFPYKWITNVPAPAPPEQGIARTETRTFLAPGDVVKNLVVSAQVDASVTLPAVVCVPSPGCSLIGPIQGVGGLLTTVDWAPGRQVCSTPVASCTNDNGGSGLGNGYDLGLVPVGFPAGAVEDCDTANLTASCPVVTGTVTYNVCFPGPGTNTTQDTGDGYAVLGAACPNPTNVPWPYEYATVNGRTLTPDTPGYTTTGGASFTA